jgi:methylase of polypeptide subunit release factors
MALDHLQARQIEKQLSEHCHTRYYADIQLSAARKLAGFAVHAGVMRPERMTSLRLAKFLHASPELYEKKAVIDMGCGSGIQGVTMAFNGAEHVYMLDISREAVENSWENICRFNLEDRAVALQSDLFGRLVCKADLIVFNHPFFPDTPEGRPKVAASMLDPGLLIHRFLEDAKRFLTGGGRIIMPFFHLAGDVNNPEVQGPRHGYLVLEAMRIVEADGLQNGEISIYELKRP